MGFGFGCVLDLGSGSRIYGFWVYGWGMLSKLRLLHSIGGRIMRRCVLSPKWPSIPAKVWDVCG